MKIMEHVFNDKCEIRNKIIKLNQILWNEIYRKLLIKFIINKFIVNVVIIRKHLFIVIIIIFIDLLLLLYIVIYSNLNLFVKSFKAWPRFCTSISKCWSLLLAPVARLSPVSLSPTGLTSKMILKKCIIQRMQW